MNVELDRIGPFFFKAFVAGFFVWSYFYPEATGHWLERASFSILVFDFAAAFLFFLVILLFKPEAFPSLKKRSGREYFGALLGVSFLLFVFLFPLIFIGLDSSAYLYAALSIGFLALQVRNRRDYYSIYRREFMYSALSSFCMGFMLWFALVLVGLFALAVGLIPSMSSPFGLPFDHRVYLVAWGVLHFSLMAYGALKPETLTLEGTPRLREKPINFVLTQAQRAALSDFASILRTGGDLRQHEGQIRLICQRRGLKPVDFYEAAYRVFLEPGSSRPKLLPFLASVERDAVLKRLDQALG